MPSFDFEGVRRGKYNALCKFCGLWNTVKEHTKYSCPMRNVLDGEVCTYCGHHFIDVPVERNKRRKIQCSDN